MAPFFGNGYPAMSTGRAYMNQPHLKLAVDNARQEAARPIPEDYGLTAEDLRIWYAPGRVGIALALLVASGTIVMQGIEGARYAQPWVLGALSGGIYGAFIGSFAGLGTMVAVIWADPFVARAWPTYGRLRRYRDALTTAKARTMATGGSSKD